MPCARWVVTRQTKKWINKKMKNEYYHICNSSGKSNKISRLFLLSLLTFFIFQFSTFNSFAQVTGTVLDAKTRKPVDYANVFYDGKGVGVTADERGRFIVSEHEGWNILTVSSLGYVTQTVRLQPGRTKNLTVRLEPQPRELATVTIESRKTRYSRKNNPAVELMRRVIAHKRSNDLHSQPYVSFSKYEKMTFSINEVTDKVFDIDSAKQFSFLKDHVEYCAQTGKLILPLTVDETLSSTYYRLDPRTEKTLVKAKNSRGINELINTGEILNTVLKDCFTDVNIYDEECKLVRLRFKSPIANSAIGFYRYYLQDTLAIDGDSVIDVGFIPNNAQDIGFSGHVYVMKDSTYQVRRVELSIPRRSDVNWVESMTITQDYQEVGNNHRVAVNGDMLIELRVNSWLGKLQVQYTTRKFDYAFEEIPQTLFKYIKGTTFIEPDAGMHTDDNYWKSFRPVELTQSEQKMESFLDRLTHIRGFKYLMVGVKALLENFVETSDSLQNNKFDFGPINTIISHNDYDRLRLRISGLTTAHLNPHLFWSGYLAYGTHTHNFYGRTQLTYSFNRKAYLQREFPKNNLTFSYWNDIISPFDRFIPTDKDNVFTTLRASKVDQYTHTRELSLNYEREWYGGTKFSANFSHSSNRPVDALFYQPLGTDPLVTASHDLSQLTFDPAHHISCLRTTELRIGLEFEPGATYINTKQRRIKVNKDAPVITLSHTVGHLNRAASIGGSWYNVTEASIFKRLYVPGGWGFIDTDLKAGIQWNRVPFPLLIHPAANQSYLIMDNTFMLISPLEFLNDRYAQAMVKWNLHGKIFNRIPLLRRLQWRETIGFNLLWGQLSDKNNPAASGYTDSRLLYFPGHFVTGPDGTITYESNTVPMDTSRPYVELRLGIGNIFKLFYVEYVRRLTYLHNPNTHRQGIRIAMRMMF